MGSNKEFWITNISNRNVTLSDLNITIKSQQSINLLAPKNCIYTPEQLEKSLKSGSLFLKRDKVVKRAIPPPIDKKEKTPFDINAAMPNKPRSIFEIKIERYEELEISNEQEEIRKKEFEDIAGQVDENTELERAPLIARDKK